MQYYKLLRLEKEPFSNSPDPDYFFQSRQHLSCIQKLEVALRLKRGINVVVGDVGTGKTTLCREVLRRFAGEPEIETHLILDPAIPTADEFLSIIHSMLCHHPLQLNGSAIEKKEGIKQALFEKGVRENKTVVLLIDEGQKMSPACMEILRELLNFETNAFKLLQIAIFAQEEFLAVLEAHPNFSDRINMLHHLAPMNFSDTCRMIHHRIKQASSSPNPMRLFTLPALWAIYLASNGYPRRIVHLCHQSVLAMIIQNRTRAGWALIRSCKRRLTPVSPLGFQGKAALAVISILILCGAGFYYVYPRWEADLQNRAQLFPMPTTYQSHTQLDIDPGAVPSVMPGIQIDQKIEGNLSPQETDDESFPASQASDIADADIVSSAEEKSMAAVLGTLDPTKVPAESFGLTAVLTADKDTGNQGPDLRVSPPPVLLGELRVSYGDTLYKMITRVYGVFRPRHLTAVMKANPKIVDPNEIDTDQRILFPAIGFEPNPLLSQCVWIILDQKPALDQAMAQWEQLASQEHLPVQMIAGWSVEEKLQFYLALKGYFATNEKASSFLDVLPEAMATQARIIIDWPAKITLFGDPYIGGIR